MVHVKGVIVKGESDWLVQDCKCPGHKLAYKMVPDLSVVSCVRLYIKVYMCKNSIRVQIQEGTARYTVHMHIVHKVLISLIIHKHASISSIMPTHYDIHTHLLLLVCKVYISIEDMQESNEGKGEGYSPPALESYMHAHTRTHTHTHVRTHAHTYTHGDRSTMYISLIVL